MFKFNGTPIIYFLYEVLISKIFCYLFCRTVSNSKHQLHNDFLLFLKESKVGFPRRNQSLGTYIVDRLVEVLWYLDPHMEALAKKCCKVPEPFKRFKGYKDLKKQKKAKPILRQQDLQVHIDILGDIILTPWLDEPKLAQFKSQLSDLYNCLTKAKDQLSDQAQRTAANHNSTVPVRSLKSQRSISPCLLFHVQILCYTV